MPITALYAGLLAPLFVYLAIRVIGARRGAKVVLGDGGNALLLRAIRVQANFAEYVPFALLLMALAESLGTIAYLLHAVGLTLVAGRIVHALGVSRTPENLNLRVTGMVMTFTVLLALAALCLWGSITRLFY